MRLMIMRQPCHYWTHLHSRVNHYLDDVLVMDKDEKVKNNRLAMLKTVILGPL